MYSLFHSVRNWRRGRGLRKAEGDLKIGRNIIATLKLEDMMTKRQDALLDDM